MKVYSPLIPTAHGRDSWYWCLLSNTRCCDHAGWLAKQGNADPAVAGHHGLSNLFGGILGFCALVLLPSQAALAQDWSADAAIVTDYVDRGLSNSGGKPALQLGLARALGEGFTLGSWASTIGEGEGNNWSEVDFYLAKDWQIADGDLELAATWIGYPGAPSDSDANLWEFSAVLHQPVTERGQIGLIAIATPDNSGHAGDALYLALETQWQLDENFALFGHVGRQWNQREDRAGPDYNEWAVGLFYSINTVSLSLTFSDTPGLDREDAPGPCGKRLVAGINWQPEW
ncbi:TorF family putative porin [Niveispirillum sp. SYP-B3756]|uniref:TorF family putative porin n=1 Tax=Niveispirillum sp. SYP-B3756 TaxID=2662178 RepID=UPI002494F9EE|nr:TorF family putative porin [Niveispirillum sp. SYP-B3756]